jgi:transposase
MALVLTPGQRDDLEMAAAAERHTRTWKRYRALLLLGEGQTFRQVAQTLGCAESTLYGWVARWRAQGIARLAEGPHHGRARRLDASADQVVRDLLGRDPQEHGHHATGWTVPLLRTELAARGWAVADRTLRRTLKRLGYRWKRPQYVLGRPDPAYLEKKGP